eukprot:symbB.v1.2.022516.t1/scaffold2003.1/size92810/3
MVSPAMLKGMNTEIYGEGHPFGDPSWYQAYNTPYYNDTHKQFRKLMREYVDEHIMSNVHDWDEKGTIPKEMYLEAGKQGTLALCIGRPWPEKYFGPSPWGFEPDYFHELIMYDEMSRTGSVGFQWGVAGGTTIGLPPVYHHGSEELKNRVMPPCVKGEKVCCLAITEPTAGSDVANLKCTAKLEDGASPRGEPPPIHFHVVAAGLNHFGFATKRWDCVQSRKGGTSDTQPTRCRRTGGLLGQRIGEASHPGPSGSRRTIRKRKEKTHEQSLLQLLLPILQPIIQDVIQELLAKFFSTGGSTTATPHTLDLLHLFKGLGTTSTQEKSKGKTKQKSTVYRQSPAQTDRPQAQPPPQNTHRGAPDKPTRGKGKGTGKPRQPEGKGAGKSSHPEPTAESWTDTTWVAVARKKPNLRTHHPIPEAC